MPPILGDLGDEMDAFIRASLASGKPNSGGPSEGVFFDTLRKNILGGGDGVNRMRSAKLLAGGVLQPDGVSGAVRCDPCLNQTVAKVWMEEQNAPQGA